LSLVSSGERKTKSFFIEYIYVRSILNSLE